MKANHFYLSSLIIILFSFFSCSNGIKKQNLIKIDSLQTIIDTAQSQLTIFDKPEYIAVNNTCNEKFNQIKSNFSWNLKDTSWSNVLAYGEIAKSLKKTFIKVLDLKKQIEETKVQLKNLALDIKSGAIKKDKQTEYINTEDDIVKNIAISVMQSVSQLHQLLDRNEILSPTIENLLKNPPKTTKGSKKMTEMDEID